MQGVLLCGGTGSRLAPLTKTVNKHILPIGRLPMVLHSIYKLKEAGINDICIVTGVDHAGDFIDLLGSGSEYGVDITYKVQDSANGIAGALWLTRNFIDGPFVVILGDNIFEASIKDACDEFESYVHNDMARVFVKEVPDPQRFGCPVYTYDGKLAHIEEKPLNPKSNDAVVGIYMFTPDVFNVIPNLNPSDRGELEIADILNYYVATGELGHNRIEGFWSDAGVHETYRIVNKYLWEKENEEGSNI
jgi:glucose-1-phosphate thymidylyltransferase